MFHHHAVHDMQAGITATMICSIMQLCVAPFAMTLQRWVPRSALLSSIAGLSITFIGMQFASEVFSSPSYAILPLVVVVRPARCSCFAFLAGVLDPCS